MSRWREHRTTRWRGVVAVSLLALTAGLLLDRPDMLLLAIVGVAYAVYPQLTPDVQPSVSVERRLDDRSPARGDTVEVSVTVHNEGEDPLFDVRVVDGVPPALRVAEDTPRHATTLRAGESTTFTYSVTAQRGKHRFEPATVVVRDLSGDQELEARVAAETEIDCTESTTNASLRQQTVAQVGQVLADQGGSGVQFYRTREYQRGDALSHIDWKRYARTGEPTTIEFQREQAASVVLLVDAGPAAYRSRPDEPHAVVYSVSAARQVAETLVGSRNHVGVAGIGRSLAWVAPGTGRQHVDDVEETLATHETFASVPPAEPVSHDDQLARLRGRLPDPAQVILFSPLTDDSIVGAARRLDVNGHAVSVISPTVVASDTPERRVAGVERAHRVSELRNADIPVVTWDPDRPLAAAVDDAEARWSA